MIKQFFKDSAIYSISGILSRGISLILLPIYTRIFSTADYGLVDYVSVVGNLVGVTIALEITQGMARYYAESHSEEEKRSFSSTAMWFTIIAYSLFLIAVILFRSFLTREILGPEVSEWITVLAATTFSFNGIVYTIQNQLRWDLKAMINAKISLVITFSSILFTFVLVVGFGLGVMGAMLSQVIANVLALIIGYTFTKSTFKFHIDRAKLKKMLAFSLPLVPSSIGVVAALYVDRIAVKQMLSMSELGVFGVGYRIASIVSLVMVGFQSALTPLIYANHKDEKTPVSIANIFRLFVVMSLVFFAGLSLFSSDVIMVLTPKAYHGAAIIVPPMVCGVLLWQMYIFAPGLSLAKKTITIGILNVASALLNLGLNYLLIPYLGILGAALATFISATVIFGIYMYYSQLYYYVPHQWKSIATGIVISSLLVYAGIFIQLPLLLGLVVKIILLGVLLYVIIRIGLIKQEELAMAFTKIRALRQKIGRRTND